jgi:acetoin utilization deacetylase AcuC-like enzyme
MTLAIVSHPNCALHEMGANHPEQPARFTTIDKSLRAYPFSPAAQFIQAPQATVEALCLVHPPAYVDRIFKLAPKSGIIALDPDTFMNTHTLDAALFAAGAGCLAVDIVMQNKAQAVFCNVRPPGHHAERTRAMGFCFFNNIAIAVRYAIQHYQLNRVAIVDFDVHHGNGTQDIFQPDEQVMLCSSFQHPFYPGYNREQDNPHILCVPLAAETEGKVFRQSVAKAWFDQLNAFKPDLICFSAGFDAHKDDPLAELSLVKEDYVWLTEQIKAIASTHSQGRMISLLEGGYHLPALAECVPAHAAAMVC